MEFNSYLITLTTIGIAIFVGSGIFFLFTKLLKIENPSYKKSLITTIVSFVTILSAIYIFHIINSEITKQTLGYINFDHFGFLSYIIIAFFPFCCFLKKYYQTNWKKSLIISAVSLVFFFILGIITLSVALLLSILFIPFKSTTPW